MIVDPSMMANWLSTTATTRTVRDSVNLFTWPGAVAD